MGHGNITMGCWGLNLNMNLFAHDYTFKPHITDTHYLVMSWNWVFNMMMIIMEGVVQIELIWSS